MVKLINNTNKKWTITSFDVLPSIRYLKGFDTEQLHISWLIWSIIIE